MIMNLVLWSRARGTRWAARMQHAVTVATLCVAAAACGDPDSDGQSTCVSLPDSCAPSFNTDYDTIYRNVLSQRCGTSSGSMNCHGPAGNQGGLTLGDADTAYNALLGISGPHARVVPGDPECSMLMERLETDDVATRMPRGEAKLADGARCAIQRWIAEGAAR